MPGGDHRFKRGHGGEIKDSNGNIAVGNMKEESGKMLSYGYVIFADKKLELRNTYELTAKREAVDQYFRFEDGEWKAGHSRVWAVKQMEDGPRP